MVHGKQEKHKWLGLMTILILYAGLATLLYKRSLPILGRPGGLMSLPLLEMEYRTIPEDQWGTLPLYAVPAGANEEDLCNYVLEADLPWFFNYPKQLVEQCRQLDIHRMAVAFRTILPDPLFGEEENIKVAADYLAGTVVAPGQILSLNNIIGPYTTARGYGEGPTYIANRVVGTIGGGVCKIASTLYNAVVAADLKIVERHPHSMLVPYVPPGRDATIAWGGKDFRFKNNRSTPIVLWAESTGSILYIAVYGQFNPPEVAWHHKELHRQPTWTIEQLNSKLPPGMTRRLDGSDGVTVQTWIEVSYPDKLKDRRPMGTDYYRPMPNIVELGPHT